MKSIVYIIFFVALTIFVIASIPLSATLGIAISLAISFAIYNKSFCAFNLSKKNNVETVSKAKMPTVQIQHSHQENPSDDKIENDSTSELVQMVTNNGPANRIKTTNVQRIEAGAEETEPFCSYLPTLSTLPQSFGVCS